VFDTWYNANKFFVISHYFIFTYFTVLGTIKITTLIMTAYDFETADFALSVQGLHLLRSGFNYETVRYQEIDKATVKRGREIKNVFSAMIFGTGLLAFAVLQIMFVIGLFNNPGVHSIYIESIVLPFLPGLFGIYLLYIANKKAVILIIETGSKIQKLRLGDFVKRNDMLRLINYLHTKLSSRLGVAEDTPGH
jgi:hypothetical protein